MPLTTCPPIACKRQDQYDSVRQYLEQAGEEEPAGAILVGRFERRNDRAPSVRKVRDARAPRVRRHADHLLGQKTTEYAAFVS
jgi:hypothetical protein